MEKVLRPVDPRLVAEVRSALKGPMTQAELIRLLYGEKSASTLGKKD